MFGCLDVSIQTRSISSVQYSTCTYLEDWLVQRTWLVPGIVGPRGMDVPLQESLDTILCFIV